MKFYIQGNFEKSDSIFVAYKRLLKYNTSNLNLNSLSHRDSISSTSRKDTYENENLRAIPCAIATIRVDSQTLQNMVLTNNGNVDTVFDANLTNESSKEDRNQVLDKDVIIADNLMPFASQSTSASVYTYCNPVAK